MILFGKGAILSLWRKFKVEKCRKFSLIFFSRRTSVKFIEKVRNNLKRNLVK